MIGLDVAGVDVLADDIGRPLDEQGGVVIEVNAGPGLQMHTMPESGTPRPVGEAIVATLFPEGQDGRIPLIAVTGPADADDLGFQARRASARHFGRHRWPARVPKARLSPVAHSRGRLP